MRCSGGSTVALLRWVRGWRCWWRVEVLSVPAVGRPSVAVAPPVAAARRRPLARALRREGRGQRRGDGQTVGGGEGGGVDAVVERWLRRCGWRVVAAEAACAALTLRLGSSGGGEEPLHTRWDGGHCGGVLSVAFAPSATSTTPAHPTPPAHPAQPQPQPQHSREAQAVRQRTRPTAAQEKERAPLALSGRR